MSYFLQHMDDSTITIPNYLIENGICYYSINIAVGNVNWIVTRRFKEFVELHDKLVIGQSISKDLLPPKKVIGNLNVQFLEIRQKDLEKYLQKVLNFLQFTMCREFVEFLEFNKYDIIYLLQDLAKLFYLQGDTILVSSLKSYEFTVLDLYAISERYKLPCPTSYNVEKCYDFSHVLDFCSQLDCISIYPFKKSSSDVLDSRRRSLQYDRSNIIPLLLKFDLNAFKNLKKVYIFGVTVTNISDADAIRSTLIDIHINNVNLCQLNEFLLCDCIHKDENVTIMDRTKVWKTIEHADFSSNKITSIDPSIKLMPKLQSLNLDRNYLQTISHLQHLPFLNSLSLCENLIMDCIDCHLELGNLKLLNLSQNKLKSLKGLRKMYSLVNLNVSCNLIDDINEVDYLSGLQCLEELILTGNPIAGTVDYRARVLSRFNDRSSEISLDNEKGNQQEIDMALVLSALRQSERMAQLSLANNNNKNDNINNNNNKNDNINNNNNNNNNILR